MNTERSTPRLVVHVIPQHDVGQKGTEARTSGGFTAWLARSSLKMCGILRQHVVQRLVDHLLCDTISPS